MPLDGEKWYVSLTSCCFVALLASLMSIIQSIMLLKLALNRVRLHKKKRRELNENTKREVASLLAEGKEEQARIRVRTLSPLTSDHIILIYAEYSVMTLKCAF